LTDALNVRELNEEENVALKWKVEIEPKSDPDARIST